MHVNTAHVPLVVYLANHMVLLYSQGRLSFLRGAYSQIEDEIFVTSNLSSVLRTTVHLIILKRHSTDTSR